MCVYSDADRCYCHDSCEENGVKCRHYQINFPRPMICTFCSEEGCNFEFPDYIPSYDI